MGTLRGEEFIGAEKMMASYLEALVGELRIAQNVEKSINFVGAEKKIMEALRMVKLFDTSEANRYLSEALSFITTSSQGSMEILTKKRLL